MLNLKRTSNRLTYTHFQRGMEKRTFERGKKKKGIKRTAILYHARQLELANIHLLQKYIGRLKPTALTQAKKALACFALAQLYTVIHCTV